MQKVNFSEIANELYKIFSSAERTAEYNTGNPQYTGICGWAGVMSPRNRAAFVDTFGEEMTARAEDQARARVANYRAAFESSTYHAAELMADAFAYGEAEKSQLPAVGSFVWGRWSCLKGESGPMGELQNLERMEAEGYEIRRRLAEVVAVVDATPAEFLDRDFADGVARQFRELGGSRYEETDPLQLDGTPYSWELVFCVRCAGRWYLIDGQGYEYTRYFIMPEDYRDIYAPEMEGIKEAREAEHRRQESEEQAEAAARLAEYRARCARWEGAGLVDVRPLIAAEEEANKAHGWRSTEAKSAARKLAAARRGNIAAMCRRHFPGVKFSVKKWDGWGGSYEVSWTDGPTEAELKAAADLDLLEEGRDTFDGMTDCAGHTRAEFVDFAAQYLGVFGEIRTSRETSPEYRAEIIARIREAVPGLPEDDRAPVDESTAWTIADTFTPDTLHRYDVAKYAQRWGLSDAAALIARNTSRPTTSEAPTDPTPDNGGTGAAYGDSEKSQNQEAPDGLTLEEIPGGVAVVGDSRTTYRHRKEIKAHGARWNKAAQRWEATAPEAVESLRQWLVPVADATPTEEPAPVAYGEAEKSQPQSEADRARVRLEEIRASIEAEAVSYGEIAELQNELRPYIAPDDLQLLEWASPEEEAPAVAASLPMDADNPETSVPTGAAYGDCEKSQTQGSASAYNLPTLDESLARKVEAGTMTLQEAARELCAHGWTNFVDEDCTRRVLSKYTDKVEAIPAAHEAAPGAAYGDCEKSQIPEAVEVSELPEMKEYRLMYLFGAWVCHSRIYAETDAEAIHDAMDDYMTSTLPRYSHRVALWEGSRLVRDIKDDGPDAIGRRDLENEKTLDGHVYVVRDASGVARCFRLDDYVTGSILLAASHIINATHTGTRSRRLQLYFDGVKLWDGDEDTKIALAHIVRQRLGVPYGYFQKSQICEATAAAAELEAEELAENTAEYDRLKEKHPDALFLFRLGEFYELWHDDAQIAADVLRLTLTRAHGGLDMCAFPCTALDTYLPKLVRAGHRVAICDDPRPKRHPRVKEAQDTPTAAHEAAPGVAYGDSQKSQKKPRMKSMSDINRQAAELCRYFYGHKDHPKMWKTIKAIEEVYCTNIAQSYGFAAFHSFTEYSCNSKANVLEKCKADDIYNARVTSEVYARSFDWNRVRQATTAEEVAALSWSLHWMGYELDLDATSLEERKADILAIADKAE